MEDVEYKELKVRNFSADLPQDFKWLLDITKNDLHISQEPVYGIIYRFPVQESYRLDILNHRILFTGSYSKWRLIKWFQIQHKKLFPDKYILKYVKHEL